MDDAAKTAGEAGLQNYLVEGDYFSAETIEELAGKIGVDAETLAATVAQWNEAVAAGNDAEFGRVSAMDAPIAQGPFWACARDPPTYTLPRPAACALTKARGCSTKKKRPLPGCTRRAKLRAVCTTAFRRSAAPSFTAASLEHAALEAAANTKKRSAENPALRFLHNGVGALPPFFPVGFFPGFDLFQPGFELALKPLFAGEVVFPPQQGVGQALHGGDVALVVVGVLVALAVI